MARRFGTLPSNLLLQVQSLPLVQLEGLAEALLDFSSIQDLEVWLSQQSF
ncbi:DUF4351 domain-containing protein (plasmid) [Synechococcus elongatus IITB7]